jgi:hypothetical protein
MTTRLFSARLCDGDFSKVSLDAYRRSIPNQPVVTGSFPASDPPSSPGDQSGWGQTDVTGYVHG